MQYKIWYQSNNEIKTSICNEQEIPANTIKIKSLYTKKSFLKRVNPIELFFELSIMLEAKLSLKESIDVLIKSNSSQELLNILYLMKLSIINGKLLHQTLLFYKSKLGLLPILFFKFGETSENMAGSMKALYELLLEFDTLKEKVLSALKYPIVLFIGLLCALFIIFIFVIPKFEHMFVVLGSDLPSTTKWLLEIKNLLMNYFIHLFVIVFGFMIFLLYIFSNYQKIVGKVLFYYIPLFSSVYQKIVVYKLFSSLYFICSTKVQFYDALESSLEVVENKFIESKLQMVLNEINNGSGIYEAFYKSELFDDSTNRLLLTGEKSNSLESVLLDIKNINKKRLEKSIHLFSSLISPILIFIMASIILWIVLAIMTPIWEFSNLMN